jgi:flagellar protein FlbD
MIRRGIIPYWSPPATMIQLTRLNNQPITVNSDLIKFVEEAPDTVLTLITGEKLVVRETVPEICDRIVKFRGSVLHGQVWQTSPCLVKQEEKGKEPVR